MRSHHPDIAAYRDEDLSLDELADAASRLLRRLDVRPDDARVAERLEPRAVRYYQTLGVVDKPLRYDGRRAVYGYRHLLQLLAVRKLQQEGHPLQVIQHALAGRSTGALEQALIAAADARATGRPAMPITEVRLKPAAGAEFRQIDAPSLVSPQRLSGNARQSPLPATPGLVAAQVAPGVVVTVDRGVVADPEGLIHKLETLLATLETLP